jgi:hypothetical protein
MKMGLGKKNWVDSDYPVFYFNFIQGMIGFSCALKILIKLI